MPEDAIAGSETIPPVGSSRTISATVRFGCQGQRDFPDIRSPIRIGIERGVDRLETFAMSAPKVRIHENGGPRTMADPVPGFRRSRSFLCDFQRVPPTWHGRRRVVPIVDFILAGLTTMHLCNAQYGSDPFTAGPGLQPDSGW